MASALADIKAALDVPDEGMGNLEGYVAKWVDDDYAPTRIQAARQRAQHRQAKADGLRLGPVVKLKAWREQNEPDECDLF